MWCCYSVIVNKRILRVFSVGQKGHNYVRAYLLPVRLLQTGNHHGNNAYFEQPFALFLQHFTG